MIKDGDLVQVIRPSACCNLGESIGHTFTAQKVGGIMVRCRDCGRLTYGPSAGDDDNYYYPLTRLLRIPPLSELDDVKQNEEISA